MHVIDMNTQILHANEQVAEENKSFFKKHGIFTANLMSAPGAGKTTLLEQTINKIKDRFKVAVIEGDLQTNIDADRIKALGVPSHQIVTGTVCHLDARMVHNVLHDFDLHGINLLFIENVGNLVCPAEFNLGEDIKVMVFSAVEGAEKPKKYPIMFHEANVVVINKIDLVPYSGVSLEELERNVKEVNPNVTIFPVSCRTGEGIDAWIEWLLDKIKK